LLICIGFAYKRQIKSDFDKNDMNDTRAGGYKVTEQIVNIYSY